MPDRRKLKLSKWDRADKYARENAQVCLNHVFTLTGDRLAEMRHALYTAYWRGYERARREDQRNA